MTRAAGRLPRRHPGAAQCAGVRAVGSRQARAGGSGTREVVDRGLVSSFKPQRRPGCGFSAVFAGCGTVRRGNRTWRMVDRGNGSSVSHFGPLRTGANSRKPAGRQRWGITGALQVRAHFFRNSGELARAEDTTSSTAMLAHIRCQPFKTRVSREFRRGRPYRFKAAAEVAGRPLGPIPYN